MNSKIVHIDDVAIKVAMARNRMNQSDLCAAINFNSGNFSTMLKRKTARPRTAAMIADALGVDVTEILQPEQEAAHEPTSQ